MGARYSLTVARSNRALVRIGRTDDWNVQAADSAGAAATHDRVSEAGEFELEWNSVQSALAPSVAVSPPGDTYIGGTYAVEVRAEGDSGSATDTALVEIQSEQV